MIRVLITGGAGFIGSHLADHLLDHGYEVRALDEQVHGPTGERPDYLDPREDSGVERLVVPSSMSVYGEGLYEGPLAPVATPEWKPCDLASVYALTKLDQERMCLMLGDALEIPTVALRLFKVYGPRQGLSNPDTGVLAIFASRLLRQAVRSPLAPTG